MKGINQVADSELWINEVVGEELQDGKVVLRTKWTRAKGEVNIGSFAKPNKKIVGFEYKVPSGEENIFKSMFG